MKIQVTQDHIDAGKHFWDILNSSGFASSPLPQNECCPIALALKTQGFPWAEVTGRKIRFNGHYRSVKMPSYMQNAIWYFDVRGTMHPFEFTYYDGRITNVKKI